MSVLAYDYEGYGLSSGSPSLGGICQDGLCAFDYLVKEKHIKAQSIIDCGESLGGGVACEIPRQRPCAAIILQSTFSSLQHVATPRILLLNAYPEVLWPKNSLDNVKALSKPHPPLLIIHGDRDAIIPKSESELFYAKVSEPKKLVILSHCGHNDMYYGEPLERYLPVVADFLKAVLATKTPPVR